jgi:hypothetical protein
MWGGDGEGQLIPDLRLADSLSAHAQAVLYVEGRCDVVPEDLHGFLHAVQRFPAQILPQINAFLQFTPKMEATNSYPTTRLYDVSKLGDDRER